MSEATDMSDTKNQTGGRPRGGLSAVARRFLAAICATLVAVVALAVGSVVAYAATVDRGGFAGVPAETVRLNYPLSIADADFSATEGHFKRMSGGPWNATNEWKVVYDGPSRSGTLPGSFTLTWRGAGVDGDDSPVDLTITVSNVYLGSSVSRATLIDSSDEFSLVMDSIETSWTRMDVSVRVTKSGTQTPASGTMLVGFTDIDIGPAASSGWPFVAEQVQLLSGYGSRVWVQPDCTCAISGNGTTFSGMEEDPNDSYKSGFVTTASPTGWSIRWQGSGCGTCLLTPFRVHDQKITATHDPGGTITDLGVTEMRWKGSKTYTMTPDLGYYVADVLVDGTSVGPVTSYTFNEVTSDHTIHVEFAAITYRDVPITKVWNGGDVVRPGSITVTLNGSDGSRRQKTLSAQDGWRGTFENLPMQTSTGAPIAYDLDEVAVSGFTTETTGDVTKGFVVTNTYIVPTMDVPVSKTWAERGSSAWRPGSVTVRLRGSDGSERSMALSSANDWRGTFRDVPETTKSGVGITYQFTEDVVANYDSAVTGSVSGFIVTNTLRTGFASVDKDSVQEIWL